MAKKADARGQARKCSQSASRYSGRTEGSVRPITAIQTETVCESIHLQEESVLRPCEVSEERPVRISFPLSLLEVMVSPDKKLTLRNTEGNFFFCWQG